jgi:hypothetical protein
VDAIAALNAGLHDGGRVPHRDHLQTFPPASTYRSLLKPGLHS